MSYIRSTSNPERLYIFGSVDGIEFNVGSIHKGNIPTDLFNKFIDSYIDGYEEELTQDGILLEEIFPADNKDHRISIRLSYEDWHIDMWNVTWYYIARSNYGRSKGKLFHLIRRIFNIT